MPHTNPATGISRAAQLRSELRGLATPKLVARCSRFSDSAARPIDERRTRNAMRAHARRIQHLQTEIADHDVLSGTIALDVMGESDFETTLP